MVFHPPFCQGFVRCQGVATWALMSCLPLQYASLNMKAMGHLGRKKNSASPILTSMRRCHGVWLTVNMNVSHQSVQCIIHANIAKMCRVYGGTVARWYRLKWTTIPICRWCCVFIWVEVLTFLDSSLVYHLGLSYSCSPRRVSSRLCMRRCLTCSSYTSVMHCALALTRALRYDASAKH